MTEPMLRGSTPVPDPTKLTDEAIAKATKSIMQYIDGQIAVLEERLNGVDTATNLRLAAVPGVSREIDAKVAHLAELTAERFSSAERLRVEQKKDTKDAVDAALSAAKEAVKEQTTASGLSISKSESATREQLAQQQQTFAAAIEGLRRALEDAKERWVEGERNLRQSISDVATTANGTVQQRVGSKEDRSSLYAGLGALGGVIFLIMGIVAFVAAQAAAP